MREGVAKRLADFKGFMELVGRGVEKNTLINHAQVTIARAKKDNGDYAVFLITGIGKRAIQINLYSFLITEPEMVVIDKLLRAVYTAAWKKWRRVFIIGNGTRSTVVNVDMWRKNNNSPEGVHVFDSSVVKQTDTFYGGSESQYELVCKLMADPLTQEALRIGHTPRLSPDMLQSIEALNKNSRVPTSIFGLTPRIPRFYVGPWPTSPVTKI